MIWENKMTDNKKRPRLIIRYSEWARGERYTLEHDEITNYLLGEDGKQCCLGLLGKACGIPNEAMLNVGSPEALHPEFRVLMPQKLSQEGTIFDSSLCGKIIDDNDNGELSNEEREKLILEGFDQFGWDVEFIDDEI